MPPTDEKRQREINQVIIKVIGVVVAVALVVGLGTWLLVRSLGLDSAGELPGVQRVQPVTPLPTTALPVPTDSPGSPAPHSSSTTPAAGGIQLSATPVRVQPMERIYLTGGWPGHDAVGLQVQRMENGTWADFGVQVNIQVGTFSTYVMTGRGGENRFRVLDPSTQTASNEVMVTVG